MTAFLPPNLLALFAARDPIPYLPPPDKQCHEKRRIPHQGVGTFLQEFEDPTDTPPPTRVETRDERKDRKRKERAEQVAYKLEQDLAMWDPCNNPEGTTDPFKTLFVARINFDTSESKLRREFEHYGPVKKINLILDKNSSKPRGFAFIEYEHERDMHSAYKLADGKKIDGRRVLVDVERSRTVKGWRPRRLGGGLGGTRKGGADENTKFSGRDDYGGRGENFRDDARMERSRSREKERRRRSRSRERRPRSRSRERRRSRERGERKDDDRKDRKRNRRSRSRERRRSRSKDRKRSRRSRSRDRKRDRRDREKIGPEYPGPNPEDVKQEKQANDFEYGRSLLPDATEDSTEPDTKWQIVGPALEQSFQEGEALAQPISEYPYNGGDQEFPNGANKRPRSDEEEEPQTAYDEY